MDTLSIRFFAGIFVAILIFTLLPLLLAWFYIVRVNRRRDRLKESGRSVPAKIIHFIPNGRGIGTGSQKIQGVDLIFEVQPEDGAPYQVRHREQLPVVDIPKITPGTIVALRLDPNNPQNVALPADWLT